MSNELFFRYKLVSRCSKDPVCFHPHDTMGCGASKLGYSIPGKSESTLIRSVF